jgi:hypothetical protein
MKTKEFTVIAVDCAEGAVCTDVVEACDWKHAMRVFAKSHSCCLEIAEVFEGETPQSARQDGGFLKPVSEILGDDDSEDDDESD